MTSRDPNKPDKLLQALRSRIARPALYFHPFEIGSKPFKISAGVVCSNGTDEETGTEYIELANGKKDAASDATIDGYSIKLPDAVEAAATGRLVSVNVVARAASSAQSRFALAYSTNEVGNSGWRWQNAGPEWSVFTMEYAVPMMNKGNGDFVGILPDIKGRPGTEFCYLSINMREHAGVTADPVVLLAKESKVQETATLKRTVNMGKLEESLQNLDIAIFTVESQTSESDRKSLLTLQNIVRNLVPHYVYFEIGSHLGGRSCRICPTRFVGMSSRWTSGQPVSLTSGV